MVVGGKTGKERQITKSCWVKASICLYDKHHSLAPTRHMTEARVHRHYNSVQRSGVWLFFVGSPPQEILQNSKDWGIVCGGGVVFF